MTELSPGTRVEYSHGKQGVVRFVGNAHFSGGQWIGIELDDDSGKNDGSVHGQRYFECRPGHGMFVRPDTVTIIPEAIPSSASGGIATEKAMNGTTPKPRQSIMSAETARKRQSLMGSGVSRATTGQRHNLRVSHTTAK